MNIENRVIFYLVFFIVMQVITSLSRKILWNSVCKAGGTTPEGVREKRGELLQQSTGRQNLQNSFRVWMRSNAPDPKLYDKLDRIYTFSMIPNVIFLILSFASLSMPMAFQKVLTIGLFVSPVVIIIVIILGIYYKNYLDKNF